MWRVGDEPDAPWVLSTAPRHAHLAGMGMTYWLEKAEAEMAELG